MRPEINIQDIRYSENILFGRTNVFDRERKDFIKNLDTIDLQAVPGSGKTTALLAKLAILERYQPFIDGAGILVISHTNTAVNLIKEKIGKVSGKIFAYPNFVGTIQSFVDTFLALPFVRQELRFNIHTIDNEKFQKEILRRFYKIAHSDDFDKPYNLFYGRHNTRAVAESKKTGENVNDLRKRLIEGEVRKLIFDFEDSAIKRIDTGQVILNDQNNLKYQALKNIIIETLNEGLLSYDYAYFLGRIYLKRFPLIKKIIQKRFRYVFVDEMQDMAGLQIEILNELFLFKRIKSHVFQRIGDKNQAIYSGEIYLDEIWKDFGKPKTISRSMRLPANIASKVEPLGLTANPIVGDNKESNGFNIPAKIIVYNDQTIKQVIPRYCQLITELINQGQIVPNSEMLFKAIGWVKENDQPDRLAINSFFPEFKASLASSRNDFDSFTEFISKIKNGKTSQLLKECVIGAIVKILKLEEIRDEDYFFTETRLLKKLTATNEALLLELKLSIFKISEFIIQNKTNEAQNSLRDISKKLIIELSNRVECSEKTIAFIDGNDFIPEENNNGNDLLNNNIYSNNGININVGTIHSTKGETHCTTLYLESYFHKDGKGANAKSYESERLIDELKGIPIKSSAGERKKKSSRMMYVGFSRPTHLLCTAIHESRIQNHRQDLENKGWVIDNTLIQI